VDWSGDQATTKFLSPAHEKVVVRRSQNRKGRTASAVLPLLF
jgi:hypothetical protein